MEDTGCEVVAVDDVIVCHREVMTSHAMMSRFVECSLYCMLHSSKASCPPIGIARCLTAQIMGRAEFGGILQQCNSLCTVSDVYSL